MCEVPLVFTSVKYACAKYNARRAFWPMAPHFAVWFQEKCFDSNRLCIDAMSGAICLLSTEVMGTTGFLLSQQINLILMKREAWLGSFVAALASADYASVNIQDLVCNGRPLVCFSLVCRDAMRRAFCFGKGCICELRRGYALFVTRAEFISLVRLYSFRVMTLHGKVTI